MKKASTIQIIKKIKKKEDCLDLVCFEEKNYNKIIY